MYYRRPYRPRRYTRRPRRYTRTKYGRKTPQYTTASAALHLAKKCYSLLNVEKKVHEFSVSTTSITSTAQMIQLNEIKTGDAVSPPDQYQARDGRTIRFKRMDWESSIRLNSANPRHVDIYLVQSKTNAGITPADVFQSGSGVNQFRNLDMAQNFNVLKKWNYNLSPEGRTIAPFDFHKSCSYKIIYDKDNDEGDSWAYGQLALILVSDTATSDDIVLQNFNYRARFIDN